jgi:3-hydroxyethyl bacteriochlorophyllide a dehydrogenase
MPDFPGMGYPLVPGYEAVGEVVSAPRDCGLAPGDSVFAPGASCYGEVKGLFGAAASRLATSPARLAKIDRGLGADGVLLALAATARRALVAATPDLIVGHGALGRLIARMAAAMGEPPTVWEIDPARLGGADGYTVTRPEDDPRRDYRVICDVSGDLGLIDQLVTRLAPGGEIVLAGFYPGRVGFDFAPAFMREARFRISAEWKPEDLTAVRSLVEEGLLSLDGLITHTQAAGRAPEAYATAFSDPACLKMVLDWSASA